MHLGQYISLLKNLKGVVYLDPNLNVRKEARWLENNFKHRNIGISRALHNNIKNSRVKKILSNKPFVEIGLPDKKIQTLYEILKDDLPDHVLETVILASCYVSSIIALQEKSLRILSSFITHTLRSEVSLHERDLKLHLQITDYAALDIYPKCIEDIQNVKSERELTALLKKRKILAKKDCKKRYWRIMDGNKDKIMVFYVDLFQYLSKKLGYKKFEALVLKETDELSIAFSLIPGFVVDL